MLHFNSAWTRTTRRSGAGLGKSPTTRTSRSTTKCGSRHNNSSTSVVTICTAVAVTAFLILQCADASPESATSSAPDLPQLRLSQNPAPQKPGPPKFSARIAPTAMPAATAAVLPQQTHKRSTSPFPSSPSPSKTRPRDEFDFSHGFPDGFTKGLPKFDFSKPMDNKNDNGKGEPISEDTNNVGFVHGPPNGFPTLEQLGGDFPNFQSANGDRLKTPEILYPQKQGSSLNPFRHGSGYKTQPQKPYFEDSYLSDPGPASPANGRPPPPPPPPGKHGYKQGMIRGAVVGMPNKPHHYEKRPLHLRPQESASTNAGVLKYIPGYSRKPAQISKPGFMKVGNPVPKKFKPSQPLPSGSSIFYAPSPDVLATSSQRVNSYRTIQPRLEADRLQRISRSASKEFNAEEALKTSTVDKKEEDLLADGSEPGSYWQLAPSPFIVFDTYDHNHGTSSGSNTLQKRADVISSRHSNTSEHLEEPVSGEQRFFPSFPAPSPYLGLGGVPFGLPVARPPLFPGPAANRAPSRYYPQFGPSKYTQTLGPPPNRGPSNVFSSAESHDHYQDNNLLGSGNFEVVRGGTYYQEDDGLDYYHQHGHDHDGDYYQNHNGHAAPHGYRVPGQDFFANFRDFADINPPSRSFSHNHETKVDPNGGNTKQPNNILEKLQSTSESVVPAGHHEFSSSSEQDPMIATF